MKNIEPYKAHRFMFHAHINTIIPNRLRTIPELTYKRERIVTPDRDFIDLDWAYPKHETSNTALIIHGLEGSSKSGYVQGLAKAFTAKGLNVCAMNLRGCSGEDNELLQAYHSGKIDDLNTVLTHINTQNKQVIISTGFSLGANLLLRFLGGNEFPNKRMKMAAAISAPVDLSDSCETLNAKTNFIYRIHFLRKLKAKALLKFKKFPAATLNISAIENATTLRALDDAFTAPIHGFKDAADYYKKASAKAFLPAINIPTILVNAQDDSFLGNNCYPTSDEIKNSLITPIYPKHGGHVGFIDRFPLKAMQWHERLIMQFLESALAKKDSPN